MKIARKIDRMFSIFRRSREGGIICDMFPNFGYRELRRNGYYFEPLILVLALFVIIEGDLFWRVAVIAGTLGSVIRRMLFYADIRAMFTDDELDDMIFIFNHKLKRNEPDYTEEALDEIIQQCEDRHMRYMQRRRRKQAFERIGADPGDSDTSGKSD